MGCFEKFLKSKQLNRKIDSSNTEPLSARPKKHSTKKQSKTLKHQSKSLTQLNEVDDDNKGDAVIQNGSTHTRRITIDCKPMEDDKLFVLDNKAIQEKAKKVSSNYSQSYLNSPSHSDMLYAGTIGSTFGSLSGTKLLATIVDDKKTVDDDIFNNFDFPFTNLVFEGGGNKGMAYVGALQVSKSFVFLWLTVFYY